MDEEPPEGIRTVCYSCAGGLVYEEKMAVKNNEISTAVVVRRCPDCSNSGWLPGLRPPV
jgi:RNase P subunit RPR2